MRRGLFAAGEDAAAVTAIFDTKIARMEAGKAADIILRGVARRRSQVLGRRRPRCFARCPGGGKQLPGSCAMARSEDAVEAAGALICPVSPFMGLRRSVWRVNWLAADRDIRRRGPPGAFGHRGRPDGETDGPAPPLLLGRGRHLNDVRAIVARVAQTGQPVRDTTL